MDLPTTSDAAWAAIVIVVMAIVAMLKQSGQPSRMLPLYAVGLGVIGGLLVMVAFPEANLLPARAVLYGLLCGVMASGFWSGTKALLGK